MILSYFPINVYVTFIKDLIPSGTKNIKFIVQIVVP